MIDSDKKELEIEERQAKERRDLLEETYGVDNVWDTEQVTKAFEVLGFGAPVVSVIRRSDGQKGSLVFDHMPRFYYDFVAS